MVYVVKAKHWTLFLDVVATQGPTVGAPPLFVGQFVDSSFAQSTFLELQYLPGSAMFTRIDVGETSHHCDPLILAHKWIQHS